MHDPLVVAFEIRRPWPTRRDRSGWRHWPSIVTVWHREPGGHDALTICRKRTQRADGTWRLSSGWRWHIHHWKIQVPALQELRRRLLTRCTWCGGPSRKGDAVNVSHQWGGKRGPWWRGARGLYHWDCSSIAGAHRACVCEHPITEYDGWGPCICCGKYRGHGRTDEQLARMRVLAAIPRGGRERREAR